MRKDSLQLWAFASVLSLLVGCGGEQTSSSSLNSDETPQPLIVVMGGNISCGTDAEDRSNSPYGMGLYRPFYDLLTYLKGELGLEPKFVVSCYDATPMVSYSMTSAADEIFRGTRQELDEVIAGEMEDDGPVFIAGHSYGGWLAMKSSLVLAESRRLAGLVTIDPISRIDCNIGNPFGCQRSPQDINVSEREFINESSDSWINIYQRQTWYLRASAYDEADINEKIATSHTSIDTHERTWELITDMVTSYY